MPQPRAPRMMQTQHAEAQAFGAAGGAAAGGEPAGGAAGGATATTAPRVRTAPGGGAERSLPVRQRKEVQEVPHAQRPGVGVVSDDRPGDRVRQVLALMAGQLERYVEGDALALDGLAASLEAPDLTADDLLATAWVLRSLERVSWNGVPAAPDLLVADTSALGAQAQRVLSAEERESLGPDAWGYLLDLRRRGTLDAGQFERVVDALAGCGMRPVSLELAREAAANVVLQLDPEASGEVSHGDLEVAH